jgi:hypothetical protein
MRDWALLAAISPAPLFSTVSAERSSRVSPAPSTFAAPPAGTKSAAPPYHSARDATLHGEPQPNAKVGAMYPVVYWVGMATLVVWTAYSAYSAIVGL